VSVRLVGPRTLGGDGDYSWTEGWRGYASLIYHCCISTGWLIQYGGWDAGLFDWGIEVRFSTGIKNFLFASFRGSNQLPVYLVPKF
jgi:hypothetical protein